MSNKVEHYAREFGFIDPVSIAIIVQAIISLIKLLEDCKKSKNWPAARGVIKHAALHRIIKNTIIRGDEIRGRWKGIGRRNFIALGGNDFIDMMIEKIEVTSDEEIDILSTDIHK